MADDDDLDLNSINDSSSLSNILVTRSIIEPISSYQDEPTRDENTPYQVGVRDLFFYFFFSLSLPLIAR